MRSPREAERPNRARPLMIVNQTNFRQRNNAMAGLPHPRAEIDVLKIEEIPFVHASDFLIDRSPDCETGAQNPIRLEWSLGTPVIHHQVVLDPPGEYLPSHCRPARCNVNKRVELSRRILPTAVGIYEIQTDNPHS